MSGCRWLAAGFSVESPARTTRREPDWISRVGKTLSLSLSFSFFPAESTFFYYVFQSSVGQLTIITGGVIPKADRLEGENR